MYIYDYSYRCISLKIFSRVIITGIDSNSLVANKIGNIS